MQKRKDDGYVTTIEQRIKTSNTLKNRRHPAKGERIGKTSPCLYPKKPKICTVCGSNHIRSGKSCSKECMTILLSISGRRAAANRCKRSKDEIKLFELISSVIPALSNHIIKDGWDADIFIPSANIAIMWNGPWHYKEMNFGNHSLKQVQNRDKIKISLFESIGIKVITYEDRHFTPDSAFNSFLRGLEFNQLP